MNGVKINSVKQIQEKSCVGCGACVNVCEKRAVSIHQNMNGFYKAKGDDYVCTK